MIVDKLKSIASFKRYARYLWVLLPIGGLMLAVMLAAAPIVGYASNFENRPQGQPAQEGGEEEETPDEEGDPIPQPPEEEGDPLPVEEQPPSPEDVAPEPQEEAPAEQEAAPEPQEEAPAEQEAAPEPQEEAPAEQEAAPEPQEEAPAEQEAAPEPQEEAPAEQEAAPESQEEAAPEAVEAVESGPDLVNIVPEEITLADSPALFAPLENMRVAANFDSGVWVDAGIEGAQRGSYLFTDNFVTEGSQSLEITAPVTAIPADGDLTVNTVTWQKGLIATESWTNVSFVTVDVFVSEQLAQMPRIRMILTNGSGEQTEITPIMDQPLRQWENYSIAFALEDIDAVVLEDIRRIGFALYDYNDGIYGEPLAEMRVNIDNMRLNGSQVWDSFEWSGFELQRPGANISQLGLSAAGYEESTGSLYLGWNTGGVASTANATFSTNTPQDWSGYRYISGQILSPGGVTSVAIALKNGEEALPTNAVLAEQVGAWNSVVWEIPAEVEFDFENITGIDVTIGELEALPEGSLVIDQLELVRTIDAPYDIAVRSEDGLNTVSWENPTNTSASSIVVKAGINNFPLNEDEGIVICEVTIDGPKGSCQHPSIDSNLSYFYTAVAKDTEADRFAFGLSQGVSGPATFDIGAEGGAYELRFNRINGALDSMRQNNVVIQTDGSGPTWQVHFKGDGPLQTLSSDDFEIGLEGAAFTIDEDQNGLNYRYEQDGSVFDLTLFIVPIDNNSFEFRVAIDNQTTQEVRKVTLPQFSFNAEQLNEVIVPAYEGMSLLPSFFTENRQAYLDRPELFANFVYVDSGDGGSMMLYTIQDNGAGASEIPGHDPATAVFQPTNLMVSGEDGQGHIQLDVLAVIPAGGFWQSASNRVIYNQPFWAAADRYTSESGLSSGQALIGKAFGYETFAQMANSPLLQVDMDAVVASGVGEDSNAWAEVESRLIDELPQSAIVQFVNWQQGAATDALDILPAGQTIWFDQYGQPEAFVQMMTRLNETGRRVMPSIDWTVWNEIDAATGEPVAVENIAGVLPSSRLDVPIETEDGFALQPWAVETQARNDAIIEQYRAQYPQDMLFMDMVGDAQIRYTYLDGEGTVGSFSGYTQGLINEHSRLGGEMPVITNGLFDQYVAGSTGFAGSIQQTRGEMAHIGDEYVFWQPYPVLAELAHEFVALYPDLSTESGLPTESSELFTYYTTFGYNLAARVDPLTPNVDNMLTTLEAFQSAVNSRTFGRQLIDFRRLSEDQTDVQTIWGGGLDQISIIANFDPLGDGAVLPVGEYIVAPNGFIATTSMEDLVAGIFAGTYNGVPMSDGFHWVIAEYDSHQIVVQQPRGSTTDLAVNRPRSWRNNAFIQIEQILTDGSVIEAEALEIQDNKIVFNYAVDADGVAVDSYLLTYGEIQRPLWDLATLAQTLNPAVVEEIPAEEAVAPEVIDTVIEETPAEESEVEESETEESETVEAVDAEPQAEEAAAEDAENVEPVAEEAVEPVEPVEAVDVPEVDAEIPAEDVPTEEESAEDAAAEEAGTEEAATEEETGEEATAEDDVTEEAEAVPAEEIDEESDAPAEEAEPVVDEEPAEESAEPEPEAAEQPAPVLDATWTPDGVAFSITPDGLFAIVESNPVGDTGGVSTTPVTVNLDETSRLNLFIGEVSEAGRYTLSVQDTEGELYTITSGQTAGEFNFDLIQQTGWTGEKTFTILLQITGEGESVKLNSISITG